jgi:hypothetical protein
MYKPVGNRILKSVLSNDPKAEQGCENLTIPSFRIRRLPVIQDLGFASLAPLKRGRGKVILRKARRRRQPAS